MERLIKHINILLTKHDFLVIAGIGGFVARCKPASVTTTTTAHTWSPPQREISFNPIIKHDDGLLLESYIQQEKMSAARAENAIRKEIEELKSSLKQNREVSLGKLGKLTQGDGEHVEYIPSTQSNVDYRFFGLAPITVPTLLPMESTQPTVCSINHNDYIHISIHRKKFHRVMEGVAALLMVGLLCIPVSLNRHSTFSAGILPLPVEQLIASSNHSEPIAQEPQYTAQPQTVEPTASPSPAQTAERQKGYYIVVASCSSVNEAESVASRLVAAGNTSVGVIEKGERARVYINKYDNREDAENALKSVRKENKEFQSAWLFITR